jgi:hypothetical protein
MLCYRGVKGLNCAGLTYTNLFHAMHETRHLQVTAHLGRIYSVIEKVLERNVNAKQKQLMIIICGF